MNVARVIGWGCGALAIGGACGAAGFWIALQFGSGSDVVAVPDLTGKTEQEAREAATAAGLEIEIAEERNDPAVASGRIAEQEPSAGAEVRRGRRVRLVRSLGGRRLTVPAIVGEPQREVEVRLRQQGLEPGSVARARTREAAPGIVIAQVPPEGTPAIPGMAVHRLVSDGPPPVRWVMPDLTGRSIERVEDWIRWGGFRRGAVRRVAADGRRPGEIVGQLPLAGYPIASRGVVELTVAR